MPTHPTLQHLRAALEAAQADMEVAQAACNEAQQRRVSAYARLGAARKAVEQAREREATNQIARDRRQARKLAALHGISIEWDPYSNVPGDGVWWVLGPTKLYGEGDGVPIIPGKPVRADPCEGDHTAISWSEVLSNVETYVADIQAFGAEAAINLKEAPQS